MKKIELSLVVPGNWSVLPVYAKQLMKRAITVSPAIDMLASVLFDLSTG